MVRIFERYVTNVTLHLTLVPPPSRDPRCAAEENLRGCGSGFECFVPSNSRTLRDQICTTSRQKVNCLVKVDG